MRRFLLSKRVQQSIVGCVGLLTLTWMASAAWSTTAAQQHDDHAYHQQINWWGLGKSHAHNPAMGWSFITFGVFVLGLIKASRKPLRQHLEQRAHRFEQMRAASAQSHQQAQQELSQQQQQLQRLEQEVAQIKTRYQQRGQQQRQQLIDQGRQQVQQQHAQLEQTISLQLRRAQTQLQQQWVQEILQQAQQQLHVDAVKQQAAEHDLQEMLHSDLQQFHKQGGSHE
ncbi:MAG: hypothetical protein AAF310_03260 [Myxococcota bacterium]